MTPHYTAAPILGPGVADPGARRYGIRRGSADVVDVPGELQSVAPIVREAVTLNGAGLCEGALVDLASAMMNSPAAQAIWAGERVYPDRSSGHLAFSAALVRAGCRDPDVLARAVIDYAIKAGHDVAKASRPAHLARTVSTALGCAL